MREIINFSILSLFLLSYQACKSTQDLQQTIPTSITQNFNASYYDTWEAVNKVLDEEPYIVLEKNQSIGKITLNPKDKLVYHPRVYVDKIPTHINRIVLNGLTIIVRGSDKISAVQITPEFRGSVLSVTVNLNPLSKKSEKFTYELLESNGTLEKELFLKIDSALR